ncbi:MAG: orotidine-5'-phosphate decarboxylase [Candidatus Aenigmarchaeota archaeon]|nr:orotidine-5'-phosphate decarboxylase [Candidatus Aenigmarchaeota archaeon]
MPRNFADRLLDEIDAKQNPSCIGLDPTVVEMPPFLKREVLQEFKIGDLEPDQRTEALFRATGEAIFRFNKAIIDKTLDIVPIYKPQMAFYECYGPEGVRAFLRTVRYIRDRGSLVIEDAKREDIGKTASFYAKGHLGVVELLDGSQVPNFDVDSMTLSPYIGSDSVGEFVKVCSEFGKGCVVLAKTSNPSSGELQDMRFADFHGGRLLYEQVALLIDQWGGSLKGQRGYSSMGAVVGATYPAQAERCREMMENAIILVPGYGTQGATGRDTVPNFNEDGYGAIVNNASKLIFAYRDEPYRTKFGDIRFAEAAREAAQIMRDDIVSAMRAAGKIPSKW